MKHTWAEPNATIKWPYCSQCLIIRNEKNVDKECKGPAKLELRQ